MGELVCISKPCEKDLPGEAVVPEAALDDGGEPEEPASRAVIPTIDIYTAKVLFDITQKMVENAVDRRVSLLEKRIEDRDREIMRTIRKIQARMATQENKAKASWWQRLLGRGK
ncbi:MAG: hypothetical protein HPY89_09620 [Pelotomaculum sp.]|uniref:Uncharacterized protein n=1 Tax=Pelotomaculum thermopropionicum (strain DSM 13744 / JCM 10971 / SI) TaxID=370438 RepID=A5D4U9_PELTS|nr:hypothetical protein [Pelotomaculum sp.]BAF58736.1 hypothetical protein PTH_0555 [Pelotomaculum thermopropionicum SI]